MSEDVKQKLIKSLLENFRDTDPYLFNVYSCADCPFNAATVEPYSEISNDLAEAHYICPISGGKQWGKDPTCSHDLLEIALGVRQLPREQTPMVSLADVECAAVQAVANHLKFYDIPLSVLTQAIAAYNAAKWQTGEPPRHVPVLADNGSSHPYVLEFANGKWWIRVPVSLGTIDLLPWKDHPPKRWAFLSQPPEQKP